MSSSMMKCGTTGFWITGEKSQSELEGIVKDEGIKSCLYLNPDTEDDTGCTPNGIASINQIFGEENTGHVPFTMGDFAFSVPKTIPDELEDNQRFIAAMRKYGDFARVLDRLERPTLIMCKSNRRAGCVQAVYTAIQDGVGINQLIESNIQPWHGAPPMLTWATTVVTAYNRRRNEGLIFRQLFEKESSTYTYLLADPASKEAVLIDPVLETVDRDWKHVAELGLSLKYVINTHVHADHITGTGLLKQHSAAVVDAHNAKRKAVLVDGAVSTEEEAKWKADKRECAMSAVARVSGAVADVQLDDGSHLSFGNRKLIVMSTPGHTAGCVSYLLDDGSRVFTGDALLIRGCGRTDFQEGNSSTLYESVTSKLFTLPSDTQVWPAHNYSGLTTSSIGEERSLNPRLACEMPAGPVSKTEFNTIMSELKLSYPKKIDIALPANLKCGV